MDEGSISLEARAREYIQARSKPKLDAFDAAANKTLGGVEDRHKNRVEAELAEQRSVLVKQFEPKTWITTASKRAKQISIITHAPKFTHSDSQSVGVLFKISSESETAPRYLDSTSVPSLPVDVIGNAAALDVAAFLQLEAGGRTLFDEIAAENSPTLAALAESTEQAQGWLAGFSQALRESEMKTGQLAKQLYFPVTDGYHLIGPLYASSLSQVLHERLTHHFYSQAAKATRQARKAKHYHPDDVLVFPGVAVQGFGGTKPQNISQLNSRRYGKGYLLSSQPPLWRGTQFLPRRGRDAFWQELERRSWNVLKRLRRFLERNIKRASTQSLRQRRADLVEELMDGLLGLAAEIQQQKSQAGWSVLSDLGVAEQLWLDPYRALTDEAFYAQRQEKDWGLEVADQFAHWLNSKLSYRSDHLKPGDAEYREWQKLLNRRVELLRKDLELMA